MKNGKWRFLTLIIVTYYLLIVTTCNNYFHDLVPPDDNRIESFSVDGQVSVEIGEDTITAYVMPGTDLKVPLVPTISVSKGATVFPVTDKYISRAFGDDRTFGGALMQLYTSGNITDTVIDLIRANKDSFTRPVIDLPINFGYPVDFLVISALGTIRQYKVRVEIDTGEGKFKSFKFDKFFNPEVVISAVGAINIDTNTEEKTVTVDVSYPVENIASYQLTPTFETNGARVYLAGAEWKSGETLVDFLKPPDSLDLNDPAYGIQTKTLTLKRAGYADVQWTLIVNFSEDPDTNRSIIDFRFTKALNPLINADYMAEEIYNSSNGTTGFIDVIVYYNGERPEELKASFISPGTVTVNDIMQISGYTAQNFSSTVRYTVTSRVGAYVRTYTVYVYLIPATDPLPQITYFSFRTQQNPDLVSHSTALIDHNARFILIEAAYDDDTPPFDLIPEFNATGTVTVNGDTQRSGITSVNFSSPIGYVVTDPANPTLKREYRVEVKFVRNLSSAAEITTFSFYKADNPGLIADVHATIRQATGAISATLCFETPGGDRTLVPRWTAQGRIESDGIPQTSGESERQFYTPQGYRAVSADGILQRNYTVTVKEINNRIYVKHDAAGRNDGTNWENAYRNPSNAGSDALRFNSASFPNNYYGYSYDSSVTMKEIWIAEGTYVVTSSVYLPYNTSFIGGFSGNEASVSARVDPASRRAVLTGDRGEGQWLNNNMFRTPSTSDSGGYYSVEDIVITCVNFFSDTISGVNYSDGAGIDIKDRDPVAVIKGVEFRDLIVYRSGGAVAAFGGTLSEPSTVSGNITITNCSFINTSSGHYGGALFFQKCARITVTGCNFVNTVSDTNQGNAIFTLSCSNVTQSGNTFTNVPSPQVSTY